MNTSKALLETLSRAWIECDPNRGGPGCEPDDDDVTEDMNGKVTSHGPRWKWFQPRAKAMVAYLYKNGYDIVPIKVKK